MTLKKQGLYSPAYEHDNCGAGFICSLTGEKTNKIIHDALNILTCLEHRGAVSSDGRTGDGAGILIEIPHEYFSNQCDFEIPEPQNYAVGMLFLPQKSNQQKYCIQEFEKQIFIQNLKIIGWRDVPVNSSAPVCTFPLIFKKTCMVPTRPWHWSSAMPIGKRCLQED